MDYSIVYNSQTGNTKMLAEVIQETLPPESYRYFGEANSEYVDSALVFLGFWTDKGTCDPSTKTFIPSLKNKKIFLFGTAGFGGEQEYYDKILDSVKGNIDASNKVVGTYMCQGKMSLVVSERYEKMMTGTTKDSKFKDLIDNFDRAASHLNQIDYDKMRQEVIKVM